MAARKKKNKTTDLPKLHTELQGFAIEINSFGEITSSLPLDKINQFLNKHVEDRKLSDHQKESPEEKE